jgi:hypothetical protein
MSEFLSEIADGLKLILSIGKIIAELAVRGKREHLGGDAKETNLVVLVPLQAPGCMAVRRDVLEGTGGCVPQ